MTALAEHTTQSEPRPALSLDWVARCKALASTEFSGVIDAPTQVMSVTFVKAGEDAPAYCQVKGYVAPNVGIKLGLPSSWNGKFMEMGCGGHCGLLDDRYFLARCVVALRKGYACIISDMGHKGAEDDGLWGYSNLQAKIDWGFRAPHVAALAGKAITERYYIRSPKKSYFMGCSNGGRQALQEAQRFPWDFDGIVAGAPPINLSMVYMTLAWAIRATHDGAGKALLGTAELKLLSAAAVAKCDLNDGVKDGVIGDPLHCSFDPSELACNSGQTRSCLTSGQIAAVKNVYAGPMTSSGVRLSPGGPLIGSEYGQTGFQSDWRAYVGAESYEGMMTEGFRYLFFLPEPGPTWKLRDFDFDRDYTRLGLMESLYDSSNPDLRRFKAAGGKMIAYQGMNDNAVLPQSTIDYYETVERTMGGRDATQSFFRLFVLPGVGHCTFGDGAFAVDYLSYLEAWVERGHAPDRLVSSHVRLDDLSSDELSDSQRAMRRLEFPLDQGTIEFTRPVYPYPTMAKYLGRGDPKDAANFGPIGH